MSLPAICVHSLTPRIAFACAQLTAADDGSIALLTFLAEEGVAARPPCAQRLAMHKELDFVKDLAQAAEGEKRSAQAQLISMERQLAGMRFDAETRLQVRPSSETNAQTQWGRPPASPGRLAAAVGRACRG